MPRGKGLLSAAFDEVYSNPPKVVAQTKKKKGSEAARKQMVAISLSKARAAGARIPKKVS